MDRTIILMMIIALVIGGCASLPATGLENPTAPAKEDVITPRDGEPGATPDESEARIFGSKIELPKGVLIAYRRSGGFAGVNEEWHIYEDGQITLASGAGASIENREWKAAPEQVGALVEKITDLGFFQLTENYMPFDTCCDRFSHELVVRSGSNINQVVTIDAAEGVPPELWQILDEVRGLLGQYE